MPANRDARGAARRLERHDLFGLPPNGIHQFHPFDPVVVFGLRLDVHFFERRHRSIARRLHDVNVGRPVFERSNEILGLAGVGQALGIAQRDSGYRTVFHHFQRRVELRGRPFRQRT